MYNNQFDVYPDNPNDPQYVLRSVPQSPVTELFKVSGAGSLQGSDAAEALIQALDNPSVDDTYHEGLQFTIDAEVTVLPIGNRQVGDKFIINGTTNLAVDDRILRSGNIFIIPANR